MGIKQCGMLLCFQGGCEQTYTVLLKDESTLAPGLIMKGEKKLMFCLGSARNGRNKTM